MIANPLSRSNMKYKCTSQLTPPQHTGTAKKTIAIINATALEANGSHEGANWLGNRTGEGEKGGKGGGDLLRPLCQCPRYPCRLIPILVREIQPAIYKIGRNTSYRMKKYMIQNQRNTCSARWLRLADKDVFKSPCSLEKYSLHELLFTN